MTAVNVLLYALTVAVMGTSWLAMKLQLGVVAPDVSVVYRFAIATVCTMAIALVLGRPMRFGRRAHARMAAQGVFMFGINQVLIFLATQYLTSGLVALLFSTVVLMNVAFGALLFGLPVRRVVALGGGFGLAGIAVVFWPELAAFDLGRDRTIGLVLTLFGTMSASIGMLLSGRNQIKGIPVIQGNAYSMAYGTVFSALVAIGRGKEFVFDPSPVYMGALVYVALATTVIGFWAYLTLIGRIGADRASYATVLFPIVALALSAVYEDYPWTVRASAGIALVLVGNLFVLIPTRAWPRFGHLARRCLSR